MEQVILAPYFPLIWSIASLFHDDLVCGIDSFLGCVEAFLADFQSLTGTAHLRIKQFNPRASAYGACPPASGRKNPQSFPPL